MKKYIVTDPKGILIDGKTVAKGKELTRGATTAQIRAFLRFKQIKEVGEKEPEKPKAPSTVEELKAALTERGIKFPEDAKKADLQKIYFGPDHKSD